MDGRWIKVVIFVLVIIMITGIVSALLDPGMGKPDDSRRTRHPAGFSISYPLGWGGSAFGSGKEGDVNYIRLAPERKAGRESAIHVTFTGSRAAVMANGKPGTFQGQPAFYSADYAKRDWQWRMQFQRDQNWYQVLLVAPIEFDVEKSPYWPYLNSFRLEKPIAAATQIAPPDAPVIVPVD